MSATPLPPKCCEWADKPWNAGKVHLLHTPTEGQDLTRSYFPLATLAATALPETVVAVLDAAQEWMDEPEGAGKDLENAVDAWIAAGRPGLTEKK